MVNIRVSLFPVTRQRRGTAAKDDIIDTLVVLDQEGLIIVPTGPGLGIHVDAVRLAKYSVHRQHLRI